MNCLPIVFIAGIIMVVWLLLRSGAPPFMFKRIRLKKGEVILYRDEATGVLHVCEASSRDTTIVVPRGSKKVEELHVEFDLLVPRSWQHHKMRATIRPKATGLDRETTVILPATISMKKDDIEPYLESMGFEVINVAIIE